TADDVSGGGFDPTISNRTMNSVNIASPSRVHIMVHPSGVRAVQYSDASFRPWLTLLDMAGGKVARTLFGVCDPPAPPVVYEHVPLLLVDLDLIRQLPAFERFLQSPRFLHGHGQIVFIVDDQDTRHLLDQAVQLGAQAAEPVGHGADPVAVFDAEFQGQVGA